VANVLHHVSPELRAGVMEDIYRILQHSGFLFIFEHNPYNPVTRHLVNTCPFDENAVLITPFEIKRLVSAALLKPILLQYTLFFPAFLKGMRFLEPFLKKVPIGGQYFIFAEKMSQPHLP
jgi:hypothetical protein